MCIQEKKIRELGRFPRERKALITIIERKAVPGKGFFAAYTG